MDEILTKQEFCKRFRIGRDEFRRLYKSDPSFWGIWAVGGTGKKKTCRAEDAERWYQSSLNRNKAKA